MSRQIFISHAKEDLAWAESLREELMRRGLHIWMATHDVPGGANYGARITAAIKACDAVIVLLSKEGVQSAHVETEVSLTKRFKKLLYPLMLPHAGASIADLPLSDSWLYWLEIAQVAIFDDPASASDTFVKLLGDDDPIIGQWLKTGPYGRAFSVSIYAGGDLAESSHPKGSDEGSYSGEWKRTSATEYEICLDVYKTTLQMMSEDILVGYEQGPWSNTAQAWVRQRQQNQSNTE